MNDTEVKSEWSNKIYPCKEGCGFIGSLDAWTFGECYEPCPNCGAECIERTGRFVYRLVPGWFPFIKRREFVRVEWRKANHATAAEKP